MFCIRESVPELIMQQNDKPTQKYKTLYFSKDILEYVKGIQLMLTHCCQQHFVNIFITIYIECGIILWPLYVCMLIIYIICFSVQDFQVEDLNVQGFILFS